MEKINMLQELKWYIQYYEDAVAYKAYTLGYDNIDEVNQDVKKAVIEVLRLHYINCRESLEAFCKSHTEYSCSDLDLYMPNGRNTVCCCSKKSLINFMQKIDL